MLHSPHKSDLGSVFSLIFKAVADTLRCLAASYRLESRCPGLRYGAWR